MLVSMSKIIFRQVIFYQFIFIMSREITAVSSIQDSSQISKNLSSISKTKQTCPKYCTCFYNKDNLTLIGVDCSFAMLNSVPRIDKVNQVTRMNLKGNSLGEIGVEFYSLASLKILDLSFNRISYIRPSAFIAFEQLENINLDFNNLTKIPESSFLKMPNSTTALSVSVLTNPISCSCSLINIYNSIILAKPNIMQFHVSCIDNLEASRTAGSVANSSRPFSFMENSNQQRFGTPTSTLHVSLAQFSRNNCAEILLTPKGQKENQKAVTRLPYLGIGMVILFIVVFLIFISLVLYFVIYKTCQYCKRRSADKGSKITENIVHSESNGQLRVIEEDGVDVIKEFQLNYNPEPLINVTNNPPPPPKPPKRSSITKLAVIATPQMETQLYTQETPPLAPSVSQKPPIPCINSSSTVNPKWPSPKTQSNGVPNGILKKPSPDNSSFYQPPPIPVNRKLHIPNNPNEHHYSTLSYNKDRPQQRQKSPTGSLPLQIEIKPNLPPRTSGLFMQTSV